MAFKNKVKKATSNPERILPYIHNTIYKEFYLSKRLEKLSIDPIGKNIFKDYWDALIVLDTCRVDALQAVSPEYDFIENINSVVSLGSSTLEWISQTFVKEYSKEIRNTEYIVCNGWSKRILQESIRPEDHHFGQIGNLFSSPNWKTVSESEFQHIDYVYDYTNSELTSIDTGSSNNIDHHPRYTTDRAISRSRNNNPERLIVHYQEPHSPYIANALNENRSLNPHESDPWEYLKQGGDRNLVWENYLADLRLVLDDVELLLENINAENVVITADHGEAFGETGVYGHGAALFHPNIRNVPWVTTSAVNSETYQPELESENVEERNVERMLESMGYI